MNRDEAIRIIFKADNAKAGNAKADNDDMGGGMTMVSQKVTVKNPTGLHLRPAGILCKEAVLFKSHITFKSHGSTGSAKSVLSVLGACIKCGDEIEIFCEGPDENEALSHLIKIIEDGLGE